MGPRVGGSCPGDWSARFVELFDEGVDNDLTLLDGGGGINPIYLPARCKDLCKLDLSA